MLHSRYDEALAPAIDEIDERSARPDGVILMYPVTLMSDLHTHERSKAYLQGAMGAGSLIMDYDLTKSPNLRARQFLLIHARDDAAVSVENSIQLAKAYHTPVLITTSICSNGGGMGLVCAA